MKQWTTIFLSLFTFVGCVSLPEQWNGSLWLTNNTGFGVYIETNVISVTPPVGRPEGTFYLEPAASVEIASSECFTDKSLITTESMITNVEDAYLTVSFLIEGEIVSNTWKCAERNDGGRQFFRLEDCELLEGPGDSRKHVNNLVYRFLVEE